MPPVTRGFNPEARRQLYEADRRWRIKGILRASAALFSLIGIIILGVAIHRWDYIFVWSGSINSGDWEDALPLGVLVFGILWDLVYLFLLFNQHVAIRPYVPLVLDLLTVCALIGALKWCISESIFVGWTWNFDDWMDEDLWNYIQGVGHLELAGVIFACIVLVHHVALFVLACFDTHKWWKAKRAPPPNVRALEYGEYSGDQHLSLGAPPKYGEHIQERNIEMHPTSPTTREFV